MLVFSAYVVVDALYALYTIYVTERKPFAAAGIGSVMYALLAFGIMQYTHNPWYVLPVALGSFA